MLTTVLGAQREGRASVVVLVGGILLGGWSVYNGVQTWRGRELRMVRGMEADPAAASRWHLGGRRRYQTFYGNGLAGIPGGLGFLVLAGGLIVRDSLDKPLEWGPWYVVAVIGTALLFLSVLYTLAYFWTGVPDVLRPPSQRGQPGPDDPAGDQ